MRAPSCFSSAPRTELTSPTVSLRLNYVLSAALNVGASVCAAVSSGMFLGWATKGTPLNELYVPNLYSNGSITLTTGRTRDTSGQGIIWKHLSEGQPNR